MSDIFETYNRAHNILELADILPNVVFTQQVKWNLIVRNENGK